MLGTLLNCAGIVLGTIIGLLAKGEMSQQRQLLLKLVVGVALVAVGMKIAFTALTSGNALYFGKLFLILLISMVAARAVGKLLHIQAALNRVGQYAKQKLTTGNRNDGLIAAVLLFAAAPLGFVGAVEDGLATNHFYPLLVKAVIDGLGAFSFARMFGARVAVAALPVGALQAAIGFGAYSLTPFLQTRGLVDPIHVVSGFLIIYVALIVFEVKKVELGDYLPAMAIAPALAWLFR